MELNRRQTELLLYLIQDKNTRYGNKLAEKFSVTDRTIRNDIKWINQELSEFEVYISANKKDGYYISGDCFAKIRDKKILQKIASQFDFDIPETQNERMVYLLFGMLFGNKYTQEDIEELLYLSPSVVYGDLKEMEKWLNSRRIGLVLQKNDGLYSISEEESDVRSLISGIYTQRQNLVLELKYSYFISGSTEFWEQINRLVPFVCGFIEKEGLRLTGKSVYSFATDIALAYFRTSQNFVLLKGPELTDIGLRLSRALIDFDEKYRVLVKEDYVFLIERLIGKDYLDPNPFLKTDDKTKDLVAYFGDKIKGLHKTIVHPEYICDEIETILYIRKHRFFYSIHGRRQIFENSLETLYVTVLFNYYFHLFYPEIELNRHDLARITMCLKNSISSEKKHILLVSNADKYTVEQIKNELEDIFGNRICIEKIATGYDYKQNKNGVDGIITTAPINETEIPCQEIEADSLDELIHDVKIFLDALNYSNISIYEEDTKESNLEKIIQALLIDLRRRGLIESDDLEYVLDNIKTSTIFFVRKDNLKIMIPMIRSDQIRQFNIKTAGTYNGARYASLSLFVFSDNTSGIPMFS